MDPEERKYFVAFSVFEGIGPVRFKLLLDFFGSAQAAFTAPENILKQIGLGEKLVESFIGFKKSFNFDSYFLRLKQLGIEAVCDAEKSYPEFLKEIPDRPFVIYIKTKNPLFVPLSVKGGVRGGFRSIAIVGTRQMTSYGQQVTEKLTRELVQNKFIIVSGLAYGVDRVAHETTISNGGITIAVFGTGLETVYPRDHQYLAERIVDSGGVLISEIPPFGQISKGTFRARDRIISGLSLGVVVTEASERSGSMITASNAAEQGREVFAVPGPIDSPLSAGTALLIKKGAKLVYNVQDILEEISP